MKNIVDPAIKRRIKIMLTRISSSMSSKGPDPVRDAPVPTEVVAALQEVNPKVSAGAELQLV